MVTRTRFEDLVTTKQGSIGESLIAQWFRGKGWSVLPVYEKEIDNGKGPRLFTSTSNPEKELVAPDMLVMRKTEIQWIEAKHKTRFTWHRNSRNWQTGIDLKHYLDYIKVEAETQFPVWLLFLHNCATPSQSDLNNGSPLMCPVGLFGAPVADLINLEHHRDSYEGSYRNYPMVYWNRSSLKRIATLEEVYGSMGLKAAG